MTDLHILLASLGGVSEISDVHIREGDAIWVRVNGELQKYNGSESKVTRTDILELLKKNEAHSGLKASALNESLKPTGDRDFVIKSGARRFRANIYMANNQRLAIALRKQPETIPDIHQLGIPKSFLPLLQQKGLILVTGATGSGKTTTLAAATEYLNKTTSSHIISLEDPVEYYITSKSSRVDQRQLGRDVVGFGEGLRAALRQDPDVLIVGELRDYETVKTALDASNTGHLVLATLHTNSARQSIERIKSFFETDRQEWVQAMLSQALLGVLSQALVPSIDGKCRYLLSEILINAVEVKSAIREGSTHLIYNLMETGTSKGHQLLNRALLKSVLERRVSPEDALLAAYDVPNLKKEYQRESIFIKS